MAYEAPQPWPYSSTQGQRDALVYITQQTLASNYVFEQGKDCFVPPAGRPNLRATYCDTSTSVPTPTATFPSTMPPGLSFSQTDFTNVLGELKDQVSDVNQFQGAMTTLTNYLLADGAGAKNQIKQVLDQVESSVAPPDKASVFGKWTDVFSAIVDLAGDTLGLQFADAAVVDAIGLVGDVGWLTSGLVDALDDQSQFNTTVSQLGTAPATGWTTWRCR